MDARVPPAAAEASNGPTRSLRDVDGPRGLPLLGNALQIDPPVMHRAFEAWQREYGALYRLKLGSRHALVLSDAAAIAAVLRDRPETWRRWSVIESMVEELGVQGVFSSEGEAWRRQRRVVMQALDPEHLKRFFPSLVRVTTRLLGRWQRALAAGESIDLQADLMRYTVDVTAGLAFGCDVNTIEAREHVIQEHLDKVFPMFQRRMNALFPYWRYVRLPSDRQFERRLREIHNAIGGFVADARRRLDANPSLRAMPANLLEALIAAHDADDRSITDRELEGNVFTMLLAGEDTTANTLAWAIHLLFSHAQDWQRLVDEVDALLGGDDLPADAERLGGLRWTTACIDEAMRLRPVAPVLGLESNRETRVLDVRVPPRTPLFCLMRPPALDERNVRDARAFAPQRWLDGEARAVRRATMPFGAGPRMCPGRYLAICEMRMVLAMLARNFSLGWVGTQDPDEQPRERMAFTMMPVGLRMRLEPRSARRTG